MNGTGKCWSWNPAPSCFSLWLACWWRTDSLKRRLRPCAGGWSVIPNFLKHGFFISSSSIITGSPEACVAEVTELGQLFASYPGFWQAWAASMLGSGCGDVATALRFLAASFASRPLNLNEVFERGLRSFMQEAQSSDLPRGKALADLAVMGPEDVDAQAHDAFSSPAAKPAGARDG